MPSVPPKRAYNSPARLAAAQQKRATMLAAASQLLSSADGVSAFTLDAVANASGVTRLTVYHQFGSRRALMEAVLDRIAADAGLEALPGIAATQPPLQALDAAIRIFCRFWDQPAVMRLQDAGASDAEFGQVLQARHERRRQLLGAIVAGLAPSLPGRAARDTLDLLTVLTSPQAFRTLRQRRSLRSATALVAIACAQELRRAGLA